MSSHHEDGPDSAGPSSNPETNFGDYPNQINGLADFAGKHCQAPIPEAGWGT